MRKDKVSMKSILQNARALRTASLSGRKKGICVNQSPIAARQSSSPISVHSNRYDQMFVPQGSIRNIQSRQVYNPHLSYEFSQPFSQQSLNFIEPDYRQMNQKYQFQQMSQMSQCSQPMMPNNHEIAIKIQKQRQKAKAQAQIQQIVVKSIKQMNQRIKQQFEGCMRMKDIRIHVEEAFSCLRARKQLDLKKFIQHI